MVDRERKQQGNTVVVVREVTETLASACVFIAAWIAGSPTCFAISDKNSTLDVRRERDALARSHSLAIERKHDHDRFCILHVNFTFLTTMANKRRQKWSRCLGESLSFHLPKAASSISLGSRQLC